MHGSRGVRGVIGKLEISEILALQMVDDHTTFLSVKIVKRCPSGDDRWGETVRAGTAIRNN